MARLLRDLKQQRAIEAIVEQRAQPTMRIAISDHIVNSRQNARTSCSSFTQQEVIDWGLMR